MTVNKATRKAAEAEARERYVRELVDAAPPLSEAQRDRLRETRAEAQQAERHAVEHERPMFNVVYAGVRFALPPEVGL